jgi:hypothetical protein
MDRRRLLLILVPLALALLWLVPGVLAFSLGWMHLPQIQPPGQPAAPDTTSPEAWTLLAVFYLAWTLALVVLLVWAYDRLDYHWQYHERKPRPTKKTRRRTIASLRAVNADDQARLEAMRRRAERDVRRHEQAAAPPDGKGGT